MKKSILALSAISLLASNFAFAQGNHQGNHPKHNPAFKTAMAECASEAGIKKPEFNKDHKPEPKQGEQATSERMPNTDRPAPPQGTKDAQGKPRHAHNKHHQGQHPKFEMTQEQRTLLNACLTKKGFEKPQKPA